ncbi:methyltransferase, FxLD system [Streptomyces subrutilus]|uniref:Protein-L-isoaspartate O-methyltransferase n=1 Tax=Streptomyces subrutilus TaxID=36818 RepID=A0A1E5NXW0_9ACTN|nr:methyltransferase, FxLD system [Streptomyces subrutilus]OEJ21091.1 methyltransferase, FxLD system [Streptomyces subrutilus]
MTQSSAPAEELRTAMADQLVREGAIRSKQVEAAFRTVPRHEFAPEAPLVQAYAAHEAVPTKKNEHGITTSSVSAPDVQAMMLEQAEAQAGMRVGEIGSGGYNAALMAEIVGPAGSVVTVDIDPDVAGRARELLDATGYHGVRVVLADAEHGLPDTGTVDRWIVTVGAWDIPPAWTDQLAEDGRLVVPLRMRGLTRSVAFDRDGDRLVSRSSEVCGFVTMQGEGEHNARLLLIRGKEIGLRFDDGWPADPDALNGVFDTDRVEKWTGVTVAPAEPLKGMQMWLASALDGFCLMAVDPELDTGLVAPQNKRANITLLDGDSLAYLAIRRTADGAEFGVHGYGPNAEAVADTLVEELRKWDRDHRQDEPVIYAYPASTPEADLPAGRVITKRHRRIVISWPHEGQASKGTIDEKEK